MVILIPIVVFAAFLVICALMTVGDPLNPTRPLMSYDQAREYAYRLQKMIACKTVSRKDGYDDTEFAKLRDVMEELFPLVHRRSQKLTFGDDCWVYLLQGQDDTHNIMLMAHHDVVDAQGQWQHPPFSGEIADGKFWGRGSVDTKTSLFAIFSALEELLAEGFVPKYNVWIASSHNEEVAGDGIPLAAAYFREQGISFDFVLDEGGAVIDPPIGGMTCSKCAMLAIHEKGRHKLVLTAREGSAHAGLTAGMRSTPTERMADFISEFRREDIFIRRITPELETMFKTLAPYMAFPLKLVFANLWLFKPLLVKYLPKISAQAAGLLGTTCAFNDLVTEENGKRCTARIMLRCIDGDDLQTDLTKLRELAAKHGIQVEDGGDSEYHAPSDPKHPAFQQISQCVRDVFPDVPVIPFILPAGTDARTLAELSPCVVRFAPLRLNAQQLGSVHAEDENVDISTIGTAVVFYRRILERYTSGAVLDPDDEDLDDELEELPVEELAVEEPEVQVAPLEDTWEDAMNFDFGEPLDEPLEETDGDVLADLPELLLEESHEALLEDLPDLSLEEPAGDLLEDLTDFSLEELSDYDFDTLSDWEDMT